MNEFRPDPKVYSVKKEKKGLQRSSIKKKAPASTGELDMFKRIYAKRGMRCCFTGERIQFHVESFMHVLSKGAFPSFRLEELNVLMVVREIHKLYDNEGMTALLKKYPQCEMLYELKEMLKQRYEHYARNKKFNKT